MSTHVSRANFELAVTKKMTIQQFGQYFWRDGGCLKTGYYQVFLIEWPTKQDWSSADGKALFNMLYILTQLGFGMKDSISLEKDTRNHIEQGEYIYLVTDGGLIATYAIFDYLRQDSDLILYLSGIMVAPKYQGRGISNALIRASLRESNAKFLAARTQNPVMYESILKSCGNVFPNSNVVVPADVVEVGKFVVEKRLHTDNYYPDVMSSKSVYGACLYDKSPTSGNKLLNDWFVSRINQSNGDAMIIVARNLI